MFGLFIISIIFMYWFMVYKDPNIMADLFERIKFKTGDIIVFHAYDNINPMFIGSYWGHIGVVFVDPDDPYKPMLFEAAMTDNMPHCPSYNKTGIMITNLKDRLEKYKGLVAFKELNVPIIDGLIRGFKEFIIYARSHMYYEKHVFQNGVAKKMGCVFNHGTNCGELVFLSLVKLGLLPMSKLKDCIAHHLRYVASLTTLQNNSYHETIRLNFNPF
jgi:hypothetical protein